MPTKIGIGFSQETSTDTAIKEAAVQAKTNMEADVAHLVIVLCTIHYDPNGITPILKQIFKDAKIVGCSTAGIILSDFIETQGLSITAIHSDEILFGTGSVSELHKADNFLAGKNLATTCVNDIEQARRQAFMFFIDGQLQDNENFLNGLQDVLGNVFPIFGAGSSDDFHFTRTFQIYDTHAMKNSAIGLVIGGNSAVGISNYHGWRPLGKPRIIDQAVGNVVKTINGKKAISLYEEYLSKKVEKMKPGEIGQIAVLYPLGIFAEGSNRYLLRNAVDLGKDGSIVCQGNIPEDSEVHLMIGNTDTYIEAAVEAAEEAHKNLLGKHPKLVMIFEHMTRYKLLGRHALTELKKIRQVFGESIPIVGMYSNGEVCPFPVEEKYNVPQHQNESISVLAIA